MQRSLLFLVTNRVCRWPSLGILLAVVAAGSGCVSTQSRQPRPLPASVMAELMRHASSPRALGYWRENVGGRTLWRPPASGYHLAGNSVSVPMSMDTGVPMISARLNGRIDLPLIVDTGAPNTLLAGRPSAAAAVRTITTNLLPAQRIRGLTGAELSCVAVVDQLRMGAMAVTNLAVWVRLEEPAGGSGGTAPGSLLGLLPVLGGSSYVTFDFPGRTLTIAPVAEFQPPAPSAPGQSPVLQLPFSLSNETVRVTVGFPNGYQTDFVVDTGAASDFVVTTSTIENGGLTAAVGRGKPRTMQGIGGELMEIGFAIDVIEVGGRRFSGTRAITGSWSSHDLVGTGWLSQFRATFDFRRRILWLERPAI